MTAVMYNSNRCRMIDFPCHCGHRFSVGEDLAGSVIQCPQCKRLNDVPLLSDLDNIDEQGIYKLDEPPRLKDDPKRLTRMAYAFTRERYDAAGQPIDLRQVAADAPGADFQAMDDLSSSVPSPVPKYDPVTGELIREIEIRTETPPQTGSLPIAKLAPPSPKSDLLEAPGPLEVFLIPLRLLKPINLLVMFFIFLAHVFGQAMMVSIASLNLMLVPFWFILHCLFFAHYGNVIDETGPTGRSELPTPLRGLSWHDDTYGPFSRFIAALVICYGPALFVLLNGTQLLQPVIIPLSGGLAIVGTILFPAALLTTTTSGSLLNLRPDRIVGVAMACGMEYLLAVITWTVASVLWLAGMIGINLLAISIWTKQSLPPWVNAYTMYSALAIGIYLMHFFCWHLGTLYRKHHDRFPWLFQQSIFRSRLPRAMGFPVTNSPPQSFQQNSEKIS